MPIRLLYLICRSSLRLVVLLAFVLGVSACDLFGDEEGDGELQPGEFRAMVNGSLQTDLEGQAVFDIRNTTLDVGDTTIVIEDSTFILQLKTGAITLRGPRGSRRVETGIYFEISKARLPNPGTYKIGRGPGEVSGDAVLAAPIGPLLLPVPFNYRSGTLTITRADPSRVAGTFEVSACNMRYCGDPGAAGEVEITGSFIAVPASAGNGSSH